MTIEHARVSPHSSGMTTPHRSRSGHSSIHIEEVRSRAARPLASQPRPFLRWAGSKRALLGSIVDLLPEHLRVYREPFLGSGSLFFLLRPKRAILSDACEELITTFSSVRDGVETILNHLEPLKPDRDRFYSIRSQRSADPLKRAAEFLYLNKTCWNGLYRVNSKGEFNVPFGAPKSDSIVDADNLRACSSILSRPGVRLLCSDFEEALRGAQSGDLAFLDPPYVTRHNDNGFVDYNETLFSWNDQIRLASLAARLADKGVHVLVTNALHGEVVELYSGFNVRRIERPSTLASDSTKRGRVEEAVFWRSA